MTLLDETDQPATTVRERPKKSSAFLTERVLEIRHYTEKLFSFTTTRSPQFRFESGQFAMIGLMVDGKPLLRAYSMASPNWDEQLEFFSIKVPDGPLTSRLQHIKPGDEILVGAKPTGTLLLDNLTPGKRLILLATGTGFAPFASILRDPETWERYETVVVAYGCRQVAELEFATTLITNLRTDEMLGEFVAGKLHYYATVTREPYPSPGPGDRPAALRQIADRPAPVAASPSQRSGDDLRQPGHDARTSQNAAGARLDRGQQQHAG